MAISERLDRICAESNDVLQAEGKIAVTDLAARFGLPLDFIAKVPLTSLSVDMVVTLPCQRWI